MNPSSWGGARVWAVGLNTFREAMRNRVLYILLAFAVGLLGFSLVLGELSLHEEVRVIKDLGLAGISLFSIVIALFLGVNLLAKELDKKTVYFVIPKPLNRWEFVLGKYAGIALTLLVLVMLMSAVLGVLVVLRGGVHGLIMARAEVLILAEVLLVSATALLFASFSSPYLSALFTTGLWVIGRSTPELQALAEGKAADTMLGSVLDAITMIVPDFHLFYISGANLAGDVVSVHGTFVSWTYVIETVAYGMAYGAVCLILAMVVFSRRDFT